MAEDEQGKGDHVPTVEHQARRWGRDVRGAPFYAVYITQNFPLSNWLLFYPMEERRGSERAQVQRRV